MAPDATAMTVAQCMKTAADALEVPESERSDITLEVPDEMGTRTIRYDDVVTAETAMIGAETAANDESDASDETSDESNDETPESDAETADEWVCECGHTAESESAMRSHWGKSQGDDETHGLAESGTETADDGENSETDETADESGTDAIDPADVTPETVDETFFDRHAESIIEGATYEYDDVTAANAAKCVAKTHDNAFAETFGHTHECAGEGCENVVPSFSPESGDTCPICDESDVPADESGDTSGNSAPSGESDEPSPASFDDRASYESAMIAAGYPVGEALERATRADETGVWG